MSKVFGILMGTMGKKINAHRSRAFRTCNRQISHPNATVKTRNVPKTELSWQDSCELQIVVFSTSQCLDNHREQTTYAREEVSVYGSYTTEAAIPDWKHPSLKCFWYSIPSGISLLLYISYCVQKSLSRSCTFSQWSRSAPREPVH